jgi:hypothetical protein
VDILDILSLPSLSYSQERELSPVFIGGRAVNAKKERKGKEKGKKRERKGKEK